MPRPIAIFLAVLLAPTMAFAQGSIELTDTQRGYNEKGVSAIRNGNYPLAISSFEASLTLGEANVTYLNLGRAYQRAGQCTQAKEAYGRVAGAPAVVAPSRDEILQVLERYSGELPAVCPATVKVLCNTAGSSVAIDAGEARTCTPSVEIEVAPGKHGLVATAAEKRFEQTLELAEGEAVEVVVVFADTDAERPNSDPEPDPVPTTSETDLAVEAPATKPNPLRTTGLILGAVGAAALTAGIISDQTWVAEEVEPCLRSSGGCDSVQRGKAANVRRANGVILSAGAGLAIGGLILYVAGGSSDGVGLQFIGGPGIAWTSRF